VAALGRARSRPDRRSGVQQRRPQGRPGAEGPGAGEFGIAGGLTCVLAPALTRDAVFDALRERRCYGTTGPRIDLSFQIDRRPMAACWSRRRRHRQRVGQDGCPRRVPRPPSGREPVAVVRSPPSTTRAVAAVRVRWEGARTRGRGRRVTWSGLIAPRVADRAGPTFAFDSVADGITGQTDRESDSAPTPRVMPTASTLARRTQGGRIAFDSPVGSARPPSTSWRRANLELRRRRDAGDHPALPEEVTERELSLRVALSPPAASERPTW